MYTATDADGYWAIIDPQGDVVCYVEYRHTADTLLSHLNRN